MTSNQTANRGQNSTKHAFHKHYSAQCTYTHTTAHIDHIVTEKLIKTQTHTHITCCRFVVEINNWTWGLYTGFWIAH